MARVVHFEVPVDDAGRARTFYETVFGWQLEGYGEERYWLATTGTEGEAGIDGALIGRSELHSGPVIIIGVDSIEGILARAAQAGAEVLVERQTIPSVGYSAYLRDPEGNVIGIFESAEDATLD
jgi:uncharacterized protein